jgi:hypothetical protein
MNPWGALIGGMSATLVLTTVLAGATELRVTRIDIPFLLGTAFSPDRGRARVIGYALHFVSGVVFAGGYWAVFHVIGDASWWLGALFGLLHALFAGTVLVNVLLPLVHPRMGTPFTAANETPLLEPPGFMLLNYGRATPLVTILAHVIYGAIVAETIRLAST